MMLQRRRKKNYTARRIFLLIILIAVIAIIAKGCSAVSDFNGISIKESKTVAIPDGYGTSKIADLLKDEGIIKYPALFKLKAKSGGYDKKLRTGEFVVSDGMSYGDILETFSTKGTSVSNRITIPEGYEVSQIAARLEENRIVSKEDFYNALNEDYDYRFLQDVRNRDIKLEGYLFPDTYEFKQNEDARRVIETMLDNFNKHFKNEYYSRAEELGMTVDEIVTLASIIERETNTDKERKKVAGVFYNRLKQGMRLQSCATVQYALGERKAVLSVSDTKIQSPYNTYVNDGLPIGPIASPGASCLEAALYPEDTDALYFVLDSNGNHIFSNSYEEHLQAKKNAAVKVEQE